MSLERLLSKLRESQLAVFSTTDLQKIAGIHKDVAYVYQCRMLKKGLINKIERGKFAIYEDPFMVSTQLVYLSYISFLTAFFLHGRTTQTINEILVATSKRKRVTESFGMKVRFVKLDPKFMFGFKKVRKGDSYLFLAELEKAIIDSLYLPRYCPLSEVFGALKDANVEKLLEFSSKLGIEAVNRRLGYMLELSGIKTLLTIKGKTPYKLNPAIKILGKFNSKWRLYVNEVLE